MTTPINIGALAGLGNKISHLSTDTGILISIDDTINIHINCFFQDHEDKQYCLNNYKAWITTNAHGGQEQLVKLKKSKYFGYIIPINSLIDNSTFVDCHFSSVYARAAIDSIFFKGIANHQLNNELITGTTNELCISEAILNTDTTSVVVIHKEIMDNDGVTENDLFISLAGESITKIDPEEDNTHQHEAFKDSIKIEAVSKHLDSDPQIIKSLLTLASNQKSPFSKYLMLYQTIEILINDLFSKEIATISQNSSTDPADPWKLKDKLAKIAKESHRINLLYEEYIPGNKSACFSTFQDRASSFIEEYIPSAKKTDTNSWSSTVYKLRNTLVHDQGSMLKADPDQLNSICHYFKQCCIQLIQKYAPVNTCGDSHSKEQ